MLEQVFLRFGEFLAALVFTKTVSAAADPCGLQGKDQVFVVLPIEKRHELAATGENLVNLEVLLVVLHGVADIDIVHPPAVSLKLMDNDPTKILLIDGIFRTEGGSVVIEKDRLVLMVLVVGAEVVNQGGDFALKLGVERLDDIKSFCDRLPCDYPVDIGVVVPAEMGHTLLAEFASVVPRHHLRVALVIGQV